MTAHKSCVLAYSGGLDTSAIIPWLTDRGYRVHALLVDVGQSEDFDALAGRAGELGAVSAVVRDARPALISEALPLAIGLRSVYEGNYRLGTALARPFIAREHVRLARELGCRTLVHGATGKGNDQVRFEMAYRTLAPELEILAPWRTWEMRGRRDLARFLTERGFEIPFDVDKKLSLDENLWHLSVEGGDLEAPGQPLRLEEFLTAVQGRFARHSGPRPVAGELRIGFHQGVPVSLNGEKQPLGEIVARLNADYRDQSWAWDLVIENRMTGVKSRGLYINPAARILHEAVDALARTCLAKPAFDRWRRTGDDYAELLYGGEYFSQQRRIVEAAATAAMQPLSGEVAMRVSPALHASRIETSAPLFREEMATFEESAYSHQDAGGYIRLKWLSSINHVEPLEDRDEGTVETGKGSGSDVPAGSRVPA